MSIIDEQFIAQALAGGPLPPEFTVLDVDVELSRGWEWVLASFGLFASDPESTREEWLERLDEDPEQAATLRWLGAIQRACDAGTRFLFMLPLGTRDYGRGDQDGEAIFTVFLESAGICVRVCAYVLASAPDDGSATFEPHTLATTLRAESGESVLRSLTAFQWQVLYGDKDPSAVQRYFGSRGFRADLGPSGVSFECGPPLESRATLEEAQRDLLQMQGCAIASAALALGANRLNADRDQVNRILGDFRRQLRDLLDVVIPGSRI